MPPLSLEEHTTAVRTGDTIYKLSHSCQKVADFALFPLFLKTEKPPPALTPTHPCNNTHFDYSLASRIFQKYSQKKRKYINAGSDTKSGDPF